MKKEPSTRSSLDIKALLLSFLILFTLFLIDQWTKNIVLQSLSLGESRKVFESTPISFYITLVTNTGAAWGAFALSPHLLLVVRTIVVIVLSILWGKTCSLATKVLIATILGGALSNMLDFFLYGAVIDFLHFRFFDYTYPIFNLADSAIFIGTVGLLWRIAKKKEK